MNVWMAKFREDPRWNVFAKRAIIILIAVLFLEVFVFNLKSFTTNKEEYDVEFLSARINTPGTVEIIEDGIHFYGNGEVVFEVWSEDINAVQLHFSGQEKRFLCSVAIADDNFSKDYIVAAKKYTSCAYGKFDTSFLCYGQLREVKIMLNELDSEVLLDNIQLTKALPFHFSWIRVISLITVLMLLCAIVTFKLYTYGYNKKNRKIIK